MVVVVVVAAVAFELGVVAEEGGVPATVLMGVAQEAEVEVGTGEEVLVGKGMGEDDEWWF